jgi:hypothetical protein
VGGSLSAWKRRARGLSEPLRRGPLSGLAEVLPRKTGCPLPADEDFFLLNIVATVEDKNTMYHSGVSDQETRTIGRAADCDIVLDHGSVSRLHATVQTTADGYLAVLDSASSNGTFLHRNGRWIRIRKAILGTGDRLRCGERELPLEQLVALFDQHGRVRLREGYSVRGKPLIFEEWPGESPRPRVVLENPRRNPLTGDIEENN